MTPSRYALWVLFLVSILLGVAAMFIFIEPRDNACFEANRETYVRDGIDFYEATWLANKDC